MKSGGTSDEKKEQQKHRVYVFNPNANGSLANSPRVMRASNVGFANSTADIANNSKNNSRSSTEAISTPGRNTDGQNERAQLSDYRGNPSNKSSSVKRNSTATNKDKIGNSSTRGDDGRENKIHRNSGYNLIGKKLVEALTDIKDLGNEYKDVAKNTTATPKASKKNAEISISSSSDEEEACVIANIPRSSSTYSFSKRDLVDNRMSVTPKNTFNSDKSQLSTPKKVAESRRNSDAKINQVGESDSEESYSEEEKLTPIRKPNQGSSFHFSGATNEKTSSDSEKARFKRAGSLRDLTINTDVNSRRNSGLPVPSSISSNNNSNPGSGSCSVRSRNSAGYFHGSPTFETPQRENISYSPRAAMPSPYNFVNPKIKLIDGAANSLPSEFAVGTLPNIHVEKGVYHSRESNMADNIVSPQKTETPRSKSTAGLPQSPFKAEKSPAEIIKQTKSIPQPAIESKRVIDTNNGEPNATSAATARVTTSQYSHQQRDNKPFFPQFDIRNVNHVDNYCDVCKKKFEAGYLTSERDGVVLYLCSDACYEKTVPLCTVCGKTYTQNNKKMIKLGDSDNKIRVCSKKCCDIIASYNEGSDYGLKLPLCYLCKGACISNNCMQVGYHVLTDNAEAVKKSLCFNCMSTSEMKQLIEMRDKINSGIITEPQRMVTCACCQLYYPNSKNYIIEIENKGGFKRYLCLPCQKNGLAVKDQKKIETIFEEIKNRLVSKLGLRFDRSFPVIGCTKYELALKHSDINSSALNKSGNKAGKPIIVSPRELGFYSRNTRTSTTKRGEEVIRQQVTYSCKIYVLTYLSEPVLRDVLAHELAHDYEKFHIGNPLPATISQASGELTLQEAEGFAEFVAACYNASIGNKWINSKKLQNKDKIYGEGYRLMKQISADQGEYATRIQYLREYFRKKYKIV